MQLHTRKHTTNVIHGNNTKKPHKHLLASPQVLFIFNKIKKTTNGYHHAKFLYIEFYVLSVIKGYIFMHLFILFHIQVV